MKRQAKPGNRHAWRGKLARHYLLKGVRGARPPDAHLDGYADFDTDKNPDDLPDPPLFGCTMNHTTPLVEGSWDSFEDAIIAAFDCSRAKG